MNSSDTSITDPGNITEPGSALDKLAKVVSAIGVPTNLFSMEESNAYPTALENRNVTTVIMIMIAIILPLNFVIFIAAHRIIRYILYRHKLTLI